MMNTTAASTPPDWLDQSHTGQYLDVRPLLENGEDPLLHVINLSMTVPPDGFLLLEAPFNPTPLRGVLAGQGFSSWASKAADGHWRIAFRRDGLGTKGDDTGGEQCPGPKGEAQTWIEGEEIHMDVRGLQPPLPMLSILRMCKTVGRDKVIIVHHERDPIYLIPELAELGWTFQYLDGEPGEVRIRLARAEE
jgi:hypothetical protein